MTPNDVRAPQLQGVSHAAPSHALLTLVGENFNNDSVYRLKFQHQNPRR